MNRRFPKTLVEAIEQKVREKPDDVCFYRELAAGWEPQTHKQFYEHIQSLSRCLLASGVEKGDRIGILARPCYEWEVADKAIMLLGGIVVGLDPKSSSEDLALVISTASLKALFVEDNNSWELIPAENLASLKFAYSFSPTHNDRPCSIRPHAFWDALVEFASGDEVPSRSQPDDVGVIIFTSGTTGRPKGIPLRQEQLTVGLPLMYEMFETMLGMDDRTLAWVPLHNGTGRMMASANYYLDVSQYFVRDPLSLFDKIKEVNPAYLITVPRILEKVYEQIQEGLRKKPRSIQLAVRCLLALRKYVSTGWAKKLTDALLIKKLRTAIWGTDIQFLISGTAPIDAEILRFFESLGVPTYEVYGLSEIGFLITMNRPGKMQYGSVGQPLDHVHVKIAADGEVLAKTAAAVEAYWGESEAQLYDSDGYFKTGDLGELRDDYLYITGRKKDIIKTSTGQRISPAQVEAVYRDIAGVDQIIAIGDRRKYLTALVAMDPSFKTSLEGDQSVEDYLWREFRKREHRLPSNRQIQRFAVLPKPLSIEGGEMTSTLKVRRAVVEEKYKEMIDSMYMRQDG